MKDKNDKKLIIAVDFDGTIVKHRYPKIGPDIPWAIPSLLLLQKEARIILLTMRSGVELKEAVDYCKNKGLELWGINENPEQKYWSQSSKVYAHIYIDDANASNFVIQSKNDRVYVDWEKVWNWFDQEGGRERYKKLINVEKIEYNG